MEDNHDWLTILQGDASEQLRMLPAESVHCCVTSPPYWGLRDYGTAQWEGGRDLFCDHLQHPIERSSTSTLVGTSNKEGFEFNGYRDECGKCGAKRIDSQLGLEKTPEEYVAKMVEVFREVRRVLRKDGTLWLNLGDSFTSGGRGGGGSFADERPGWNGVPSEFGKKRGIPGLKPKDLCGIPWRVAFALQADGWWLRSDIIWAKPNPMPESVTDRPTKAHEYLFLLTKSANYFYDATAIMEPQNYPERRYSTDTSNQKCSKIGLRLQGGLHDGREQYGNGSTRNKRSVWTVATAPFSDWTETVRWKRVEAGARGDGTRRIVSPNSLSDGGLYDLLATVLYDEHGEKSLTDICGICNRLSLEPRAGYVPSEQLRAYYFGGENLDSFLRRRLNAAIGHNNGKNKTVLYVATNLSCKPYVERLHRIGRILEIHGWSEQDRDMLLSNTWPDDWPVHLWEQTLYHIGDNASCEGIYRKTSKMTSHFACYPPDLIKPCILAGTSAKGCCTKCGAPWERITETKPMVIDRSFNHPSELRTRTSGRVLKPAESKTIGWQPTCKCGVGIADCGLVPCTVLDPFAGSGTTGAVALELGRKAILIELNPAYIPLIKERCNVTLGLALA